MTLIARDEMDSWVQMTNLAAAAEKRNREPLSHLTTRINALFHTDLDNEANPLSPNVACDIFAQQIRDLSLPPAVQRVYGQSFGKTFLKGLSALYADLNTLLKERGVVPDIVRTYAVRKAEAPPDHRAAQTTAPMDRADEGITSDRADVPTAGCPADLPVEDRVMDQVLSRQDLQDLFQDFRREKDATYRQGQLDYVSLLDQMSERIGDVEARLAPRDLRSLELAEAVFNGLTTNQGLAPELRQWVLGLEELVTDTILNDESFVISRAHPARQFISDVAEIGAAGAPLDRELIALLPEIGALLDMGGDTPQSAFEEALWRIEPLLQRKRDLELQEPRIHGRAVPSRGDARPNQASDRRDTRVAHRSGASPPLPGGSDRIRLAPPAHPDPDAEGIRQPRMAAGARSHRPTGGRLQQRSPAGSVPGDDDEPGRAPDD